MLSILGPCISSIEHHLINAPFLVKGIDLPARDRKMTKLLNYDTYVETDYSRFDMTISEDWLELIQNPVLKSFIPDDEHFSAALDLSIRTKGVSSCGLTYNIVGTRCSGDAHTSIGNGILNAFNTFLLFEDLMTENKVSEDVVAFHEGDDGVIALTAPYSSLAPRVFLLNTMGFVVKAFITQDITAVSFCGRFLYDDEGKIASYCDPVRTLSKIHITMSQGDLKKLLLAKVMSYSHTDGSTPIIGPVCIALRRLLKQHDGVWVRRRAMLDRYVFRTYSNVDFDKFQTEVKPACRYAFAMRTGVSPEVQIRLEEYYLKIFLTRIPKDMPTIDFGQDILSDKINSFVAYMPSMHD